MEWKNRTISIFDTKYRISFVERDWEEDGMVAMGQCASGKCHITVALADMEGKPHDDFLIRRVLLHEIIHAILNEGQYAVDSEDEPLVEWLARCLDNIIFKQKSIWNIS